MRIAFLVDWFPNLSETFILNQITGLLDRGNQVDVYASGPSNQPVQHADVETYDLLRHTFYHGDSAEFMPLNKLARAWKAVGLAAEFLPKKPAPVLNSLNIFKFGKRAASLSLFYKTVIFLTQRSDEYDIVHCHFGPNGNLAALLKEVGAIKGKLVTTFHGYDIAKYTAQRDCDVYDHLFRVGDLFLPVSDRWKNELIRWGCPRQKIVVHRMGVDTSKFQFVPRHFQADGKIRLLTIARLVEKKGVKYGMEAVAETLKQYPNLEYKIAGDGPLFEELETLKASLNAGNNIQLLGWKSHQEILALMQEADILIAPSVTAENGDQEGIPVVLMEALARGVPILSTQHSGIPELVQDRKSGFLVPERNVAALAERLAYLIQHPEIWSKMGQFGRARIEKSYDQSKLNDNLVRMYEALLDTNRVGFLPVTSASSTDL